VLAAAADDDDDEFTLLTPEQMAARVAALETAASASSSTTTTTTTNVDAAVSAAAKRARTNTRALPPQPHAPNELRMHVAYAHGKQLVELLTQVGCFVKSALTIDFTTKGMRVMQVDTTGIFAVSLAVSAAAFDTYTLGDDGAPVTVTVKYKLLLALLKAVGDDQTLSLTLLKPADAARARADPRAQTRADHLEVRVHGARRSSTLRMPLVDARTDDALDVPFDSFDYPLRARMPAKDLAALVQACKEQGGSFIELALDDDARQLVFGCVVDETTSLTHGNWDEWYLPDALELRSSVRTMLFSILYLQPTTTALKKNAVDVDVRFGDVDLPLHLCYRVDEHVRFEVCLPSRVVSVH
jgi:hypothetical protein